MILVAIGANLAGTDGEPPVETCRRAVAAMALLPGTHIRRVSRWYETAPVPPSAQPMYINAVARLGVEPGVTVDPADLLARLMEIETRFGRVRGAANAARTLDLDIIAMGEGGQLMRSTPDPILPHPRAHERAFVLAPLVDVAPGWIHPVLGLPAEALLARLSGQEIRVMAG